MRILYLTNGFPYPLTSGYLRHYFLIKELAQRHTITLASIVGANFRPEHSAALRPYTEQVLTFASTSKSRSLKRKLASRLRALTDSASADPAVQQMRQAVTQLTSDDKVDLVLFSGKRTFPAITQIHGVPVIADMCDATSLRIRGAMRYARPTKLPLLLLDYQQIRRIEQRLIEHASHLLFASWRDREALLGKSRARATVVPNGVDLDYWRRQSPHRGADTIVFTGAMDYPPNVDAALYLVEEIFPLVRQAIPTARLLIVGRDPTPRLVAAGRQTGVTVTGFVEDVRPYLEQATVFAAPLRFGAGIQNKVLEAMAMEVPVVASPLAAGGVRVEGASAPPLGIAQNQDALVKLICQHLISQRTNPEPAVDARTYVETHFAWRRSGECLEHIIDALCSSPVLV